MTFNKKLFSQLLEKAKGDRSINQFALHSGVSSAHISRLLRELLDASPTVDTIKKISDKAYNNVTYFDLMQAAGHIPTSSQLPFNQLQETAKEGSAAYELSLKVMTLPLVKTIPPLGEPLLAQDNIQGYVELPRKLAEGADFALIVRGNEMRDVGIFDGDCLLVRQQSTAANGQTVIARLGGEVTIKRIYAVGNQVRLEPARGRSANIAGECLEIIGVVLGLTRKID